MNIQSRNYFQKYFPGLHLHDSFFHTFFKKGEVVMREYKRQFLQDMWFHANNQAESPNQVFTESYMR